MSAGANSPVDPVAAVKRQLAREVLRSSGSLRFVATGLSMLPAIRPGDTLVVERALHNQIRAGDILVTDQEGKLVGHRVLSIQDRVDGRFFMTQGDASKVVDRPVPESAVLGRVTHLQRGGARIAARQLRGIDRGIAGMLRRILPAAIALNDLRRTLRSPQESAVPCRP